ncbi:hypothetical protein [Taklimakanibacter deserti]|uniref:hypothetical protein n=1 Tax=Taklimakanibacter deserti TaxID=2267839 RepID=UPI000E655646
MKRRFILPLGLVAMAMPALAEEISVTGCAAAGVEANCIILKTGDKTYDITSAQPAPAPGTYGTVKGTLTDKLSICQQGPVIDPAIWEVDAGKQCPVETSQ